MVNASFVTDPSTSVAVIVIVPPFDDVVSDNAMIPPAANVTPFAPDVFDVIIDVVAMPAATPKIPSFVIDPSTSTDAIVTMPSNVVPVVVNVMPDPSANCTDPPDADNVTVCVVAFDVFENVCNSLETDPSTSVAVNVMTLPDSDIDNTPAAVNVTSVEPDVFDEIIDVVPLPAPTVNEPSLETDPSTSTAPIVNVLVAGT